MRTNVQHQMMEAFEGLAEDSSLKAVTFSAVIEAGGVSRSYAYRLYPRGVESMVQELHEALLDQGIRALRTKIRELEPPITFDQAVRAGIEAVVDTIYDHSLTTRVFGNDPLLLRQYLTVESDGTLVSVLGDYAANCAATFGSLNPGLPEICRTFVWNVLVELSRTLTRDGKRSAPSMVSGPFVDEIERLLGRLLSDINSEASPPQVDITTKRLARAIAVPERPDASHFALILT